MPIGTSNISMSDIEAELKYGAPLPGTNLSMDTRLYVTSNNSFTATSGNFHNLAMALPSTVDTFKDAIFDFWTIQDDMGLGNWAGYDHDYPVMLDFQLVNNSPDNINYDLEVSATPGALGGGTTVSSGPLVSGATVTLVLNTGLPAYTTFGTGNFEYFINARFQDTMAIPARCVMAPVAASDTDAVGTGTTRTTYFTANGPYDIVVLGTFDNNLVSGNIWNLLGQGISWNKRTSFQVIFS